jgi:hypothetical protein
MVSDVFDEKKQLSTCQTPLGEILINGGLKYAGKFPSSED